MPDIILPNQRIFVSKPWGWEDWILNDESANFCQKVLFIKAGQRGSIHVHPIKDEVLCCDSGCMLIEYLQGDPATMAKSAIQAMVAVATAQILPGMAIRFHPGDWHRFSAGSDTYVYESSTFHSDDDVKRADDWTDVLGPQTEDQEAVKAVDDFSHSRWHKEE